MTVVPDTKDWTWVLRRPCPECGLDTRSVHRDQVAGVLRLCTASWAEVLASGGEDVTVRPSPERWSVLEYGCHVRDVFWKFDERLHLMLTTDNPHFANWDQDATAIAERYGEQSPARVAAELQDAGERLAARFAAVEADQWGRPGVRGDGASFTVETLGRYGTHDPFHHLYDIGHPLDLAPVL
jgi:hypothetical protein